LVPEYYWYTSVGKSYANSLLVSEIKPNPNRNPNPTNPNCSRPNLEPPLGGLSENDVR